LIVIHIFGQPDVLFSLAMRELIDFFSLVMGGVPSGEYEIEAGNVQHTSRPGHSQEAARDCH